MVSQTCLVATLGGQPQIITFMLDLLLERGIAINQVIIIYLAGQVRYRQAYQRLEGEFAGGKYQGQAIHLRAVPVYQGNDPLGDAIEPVQVEAIRQAFTSLLSELKGKHYAVHLAMSGGRRIMALVGLAAATQHLTPADKLWHLHTPEEITKQGQAGQLMHAPTGCGVCLIEVPFVPWTAYFPGLAPLLDKPPRQVNAAWGWIEEEDRRRCLEVWSELTARQRDVLRLISQGTMRKESAQRLSVSTSTIDTHRENIIAVCEKVWAKDQLVFNMKDLQDKFRPFLASLD